MRTAAVLLLCLGCASSGDKSGDSAAIPTSTGTPSGTAGGLSSGTTASVRCPDTAPGLLLEASTGCYEGRAADGVEGFLGIAYAEPPVGDLRWARPVPIAPVVDAVVPALAIGSPCIQTNGTVDLDLVAGEGSEDCLFLNVQRPEGTRAGDGLPILFFVHGGGHIDGHGGSPTMIGQSFARDPADPPLIPEGPDVVSERGAIVVTVNYRLAQLGWLGLPGLSAEGPDGASANQGLWDVLTALEWTHDNAVALGGDPDQLLLFGESAGSVATCALLTSPLAAGLYSAALMQSGGCAHIVSGLSTAPPLQESAYGQGQRLAEALSCDTAGTDADVVACLRSRSATEVMAVMQGQWGSLDLGDESYGPVVDGVLLPDLPEERIVAGLIPDVPVYIGVNRDEGTLFTTFFPIGGETAFDNALLAVALAMGWNATELQDLYDPQTRYGGSVADAYAAFYGDFAFVCPARKLADQLSAHTDVRAYWWTHENPFTAFLGAHHGVEIGYAFGTGLKTADEAAMIAVATGAWASIPIGAPAVDGVGAWPIFGSSVPDGGQFVTMATTPSIDGVGPRKEQCDWMDAQPGW